MREIKFRVWAHEHKLMSKTITPFQKFPFNIDIIFIQKKKSQPLGSFVMDINSYEVMQYTGLKDKNGKEIYEGDILTSGTGKYARAFEVAWEDDHLAMDRMDDEYSIGCGFNIGKSDTKYVEVIGNIYENPELLK